MRSTSHRNNVEITSSDRSSVSSPDHLSDVHGTHGHPRISMTINDCPWRAMDIHGCPWMSKGTHGCPWIWITLDIHGYPWLLFMNLSMDIHWHSMDFHEHPWTTMHAHGNDGYRWGDWANGRLDDRIFTLEVFFDASSMLSLVSFEVGDFQIISTMLRRCRDVISRLFQIHFAVVSPLFRAYCNCSMLFRFYSITLTTANPFH